MSALHDVKLAERLSGWLDSADDMVVATMASGNISDWGQYQRKIGYRKAISDFRTVLKERLEELLKE
ncbi:hypothetical protein [Bradyrhizobium sp. Ai1a-2]|uniref:hypothetical protein n=1 Tax=Bradyrhizobium sp. Ai1a-2 TaxID=196490 RepID=UPI000482C293|nr:hypothetical protein [Bradyrhizobium sp. Ai1a-2]